MPTVECTDCKAMVSTSAEVCPGCGARYPAPHVPCKVTVHRERSAVAHFARMLLTVDGQKVGELRNDEAVTFDLPLGDHILKAQASFRRQPGSGVSGRVVIRVRPARSYRVEANFRWGGADFWVAET
jgi:RNA polymerase subunit RPABC4/transcription elongation factor Spt4